MNESHIFNNNSSSYNNKKNVEQREHIHTQTNKQTN